MGLFFADRNLSNLVSAPVARTNLGGTTVGQSLFLLPDPSAVAFPRINLNNSVTALSAGDYRTALGVGAGDSPVFAGARLSGLTIDGGLLRTDAAGVVSQTVLTGTSNQVVVTPGAGLLTLSLPQSIHTAAAPRFERLGIGVAPAINAGIYQAGTLSGATIQYGMLLAPTFGTDSTAQCQGLKFGLVLSAGLATAQVANITIADPTGAGTCVANYGINIGSMMKGSSTNYGIFSQVASSANGAANIWASGTAKSYFNGSVVIGTTTETAAKLTVLATTAQQAWQYDGPSNQLLLTVGATGAAVFSASGSGAAITIGDSGDKFSVFGVAPAVRQGAWTQTYATTSATVPLMTAATMTSFGVSANAVLVDVATASLADPVKINANFDDCAAQINALRVDSLRNRELTNLLIDYDQLFGFSQ